MKCVTTTSFSIFINDVNSGYFRGASVSVLKNAIEEFGRVAGLISNYNKNTIIFSSLSEEEKQNILEVPFKVEKLPIKYLGVPFTTNRIGIKEGKSLIEKVENDLISNRDMYDERFSARMTVYEMTGHSNWRWPVVWTNKFPILLSIQNSNLNEQAEDKIMWKNKEGRVNNFSVKQNYTDLLVDEVDVEWYSADFCFNGNSINSIIRRLSFAASVYLLRQKRNRRIFKDERRSNEELFRIFNETVRLRLMSLNVNDSSAFRKEQEAWDVKFCIKKVDTIGREDIRCKDQSTNGLEGCDTWDGGKGTWGGRVRSFGTVPVVLRTQEIVWGKGLKWRESSSLKFSPAISETGKTAMSLLSVECTTTTPLLLRVFCD
uniref:RNA-directed DNA polymerase, eukaryota, reverse transcriptase zinc-binding domain protein n=1 Tax=Tanacetum cinerariifolium TaxID=118510 RepID=A0A6L2KVJ3_TANCI|nr:RNA-directed DNA polymerase, eukaryota, reverse transcriptase zinc-binding domain protein [Tanacetum cinerariifolium]